MLIQFVILLAAISGTGSLTALLTWLVLRNRPARRGDEDYELLTARLEAVRRRLAEHSEMNRLFDERVDFLERLLEHRAVPRAGDEAAVRTELLERGR